MQIIPSLPIDRFGQNQLSDLRSFLDKRQASTELVQIGSVNDLTLTPEGKTKTHKYSVSLSAITQIAQIAAPGLSKIFTDLSGIVTNLDDSPVSETVAIEIFNKAITLRSSRYDNKLLVVDLNSRRIDGIISMHYQYLSNKELFDEIEQCIDSMPGLKFFEAWHFGGRTLTVSYKYDKAIDSKLDEYFPGYYFANNEVSQGSVRVAQALLRPKYGERAIDPLSRNRLLHSGRKFSARIRRTIHEGLQRPWPIDKIANLTEMPRSRGD